MRIDSDRAHAYEYIGRRGGRACATDAVGQCVSDGRHDPRSVVRPLNRVRPRRHPCGNPWRCSISRGAVDRPRRDRLGASARGYRLLTGYRGRPAVDLKAIEEVLLRMSQLVEAIPEISELDLNPIFALPEGKGCRIVDARIRIGKILPTDAGEF